MDKIINILGKHTQFNTSQEVIDILPHVETYYLEFQDSPKLIFVAFQNLSTMCPCFSSFCQTLGHSTYVIAILFHLTFHLKKHL